MPSAEPLLERWPFSVAYHHEGAHLRLMFSSDACLNLVATPAAFRSIGDARSFLQALAVPALSPASYTRLLHLQQTEQLRPPARLPRSAATTGKLSSSDISTEHCLTRCISYHGDSPATLAALFSPVQDCRVVTELLGWASMQSSRCFRGGVV